MSCEISKSKIPDKYKAVVQAACEGKLPEGEILTFDHIIEVAEKAKLTKGFVQYSDYESDLLGEVLNGHWPASSLGFRLQNIRYALIQRGWTPKDRPVKFFPSH